MDSPLPEIPELMGLTDPFDASIVEELGEETPMMTITQLVDESFIGFFNVMTHGFIGSPPVLDTGSFLPKARQFMSQIRDHIEKKGLCAFFKLTHYGYIYMCQVVMELSFCSTYDHDLSEEPLSSESILLMFVIFSVYYGVEQFMYHRPKLLEEIPGLVLRFSFCRALVFLARTIGDRREKYLAGKTYYNRIQSGANMMDMQYKFCDPIEVHSGSPFDTTRYRLDISLVFQSSGMAPVIRKMHRKHYTESHKMDDLSDVKLPDFCPDDLHVITSKTNARMFPKK